MELARTGAATPHAPTMTRGIVAARLLGSSGSDEWRIAHAQSFNGTLGEIKGAIKTRDGVHQGSALLQPNISRGFVRFSSTDAAIAAGRISGELGQAVNYLPSYYSSDGHAGTFKPALFATTHPWVLDEGSPNRYYWPALGGAIDVKQGLWEKSWYSRGWVAEPQIRSRSGELILNGAHVSEIGTWTTPTPYDNRLVTRDSDLIGELGSLQYRGTVVGEPVKVVAVAPLGTSATAAAEAVRGVAVLQSRPMALLQATDGSYWAGCLDVETSDFFRPLLHSFQRADERLVGIVIPDQRLDGRQTVARTVDFSEERLFTDETRWRKLG